jgi:hypothetical protein
MTLEELQEYQQFIDLLVQLSEKPGIETRVIDSGWPEAGTDPDVMVFNELIASLSEEQREIVAKLMRRAREDGVHDVIVKLEEYNIVSPNGITLPRRPYRQFRLDDWYCRKEGDEWGDVLDED